MKTLLIDGDIFIYRITAASEIPIEWDNDLWTLHSDLDYCKEALDRQITEYKTALNADNIVIALSPPTNFRYRIYPQYKSNRKGKRKPITYHPLKNYTICSYNTYQRPDIEGDDILGILATSPVIIKGDKTIVSLDKDMRTIPCTYCDMRDPITEVTVTEDEANYRHMLQTLTGDTADGYPGCPGIGAVTAEKILTATDGTYPEMWKAVIKTYEKKGLSEETALIQAQIARICRRDDYDFKKKEVIPWTPPTTTTKTAS